MKTVILLIITNLAFISSSFADFKISLIPYKITGDQSIEQIGARVSDGVAKAAADKPSLIMLPELISFDLIPVNGGDNIAENLKKHAAYFEQYVELAKSLAKKHKLNLLAGSFQRIVDGEILNTAVLVKKDGSVIFQDKLFLTPWEVKQGWSNGKRLNIFEIDGIKMVILICHDSEFPVVSQAITKAKPEVILVPSMTDDNHGYARVSRTSMARAVEHMAYVLQLGTTSLADAPWHTYYGNAALWTPQNSSFANAESGSEVGSDKPMLFKLNIKKLRATRAQVSQVYPARDQNARPDPIIVDTSLVEGAKK